MRPIILRHRFAAIALLGWTATFVGCDDGGGDAPSSSVTCGDAVREGVEQCDDGNSSNGDGCSALCEVEFCGDGVVQSALGEACDDGNLASGDGCSSSCLPDEPVCVPPDPACTPQPTAGVRFADVVVEAPGHTGEGFLDSAMCVNGVRGKGEGQGSFDVFSLGYAADDSYVVLRWSDAVVQNGPGADFAVFENGFKLFTEGDYFMDLVVVELSQDGESWVAFPHDYVAEDETSYSKRRDDWVGFAGRSPVLLNLEDNPVDPFDPVLAGGDHFDLDGLPDDGALGSAIKEFGFTFIRLTTAPTLDNPDTGAPYTKDITSNGADIDGIYGRYVVEETAE